jgi:hypothetical protein
MFLDASLLRKAYTENAAVSPSISSVYTQLSCIFEKKYIYTAVSEFSVFAIWSCLVMVRSSLFLNSHGCIIFALVFQRAGLRPKTLNGDTAMVTSTIA